MESVIPPLESVRSPSQPLLAYKVARSDGTTDGGRTATRVIITLEIPADARHNMDRAGVVNKLTAQHRVDRARVRCIQDVDGNHYDAAKSAFSHVKPIEYRVGHLARAWNWDANVDAVAAGGIHVFLTRRVAEQYTPLFMEEAFFNGPSYNGVREEYFENGQLSSQATYKDGVLHGVYRSWYCVKTRRAAVAGAVSGPQLHSLCEYANGKPVRKQQHWDTTGQLLWERTFKEGEDLENDALDVMLGRIHYR